MFRRKYKKYPLEFSGNPIDGIQYFMTIYSGSKALRMLIDSGAEFSIIGNIHLKGCNYDNCGYTSTSYGISGNIKTRNIVLDYDIEQPTELLEYGKARFNQEFKVALKKDSPMFNSDDSEGFAGLLGSTFLQFCDLNLRDGYIKVYNKPGIVTKTLSSNFSLGNDQDADKVG